MKGVSLRDYYSVLRAFFDPDGAGAVTEYLAPGRNRPQTYLEWDGDESRAVRFATHAEAVAAAQAYGGTAYAVCVAEPEPGYGDRPSHAELDAMADRLLRGEPLFERPKRR